MYATDAAPATAGVATAATAAATSTARPALVLGRGAHARRLLAALWLILLAVIAGPAPPVAVAVYAALIALGDPRDRVSYVGAAGVSSRPGSRRVNQSASRANRATAPIAFLRPCSWASP